MKSYIAYDRQRNLLSFRSSPKDGTTSCAHTRSSTWTSTTASGQPRS
ncbi:hypothetical protein LINGRAHAP2_LOCUS15426 [Linum grandiflorum]